MKQVVGFKKINIPFYCLCLFVLTSASFPVLPYSEGPVTYLRQPVAIQLAMPALPRVYALSFPLAGRIYMPPTVGKIEYIAVTTAKGGQRAVYFVPLRNGRFTAPIWLRFGAGIYEITISRPIPSTDRSTLHFTAVASCRVYSNGADLRDLLPSRGIPSDHPRIKTLAAAVTYGQENPRACAYAIYKYVSTHFNYDVSKWKQANYSWQDDALKFLATKRGVCQDFSHLTIAMLRAVHIPARLVEGYVDGVNHNWVEANWDGRWETLDPTWGAGYLRGDGQFVSSYDPRYFMPPSSFLQRTHQRIVVTY